MFGSVAFASKYIGKTDAYLKNAFFPALKMAWGARLELDVYCMGNENVTAANNFKNILGDSWKGFVGHWPEIRRLNEIHKYHNDKPLYINAWDPHSVIGNGNDGDMSLDGFMGRSTAMAALGTPFVKSLPIRFIDEDGKEERIAEEEEHVAEEKRIAAEIALQAKAVEDTKIAAADQYTNTDFGEAKGVEAMNFLKHYGLVGTEADGFGQVNGMKLSTPKLNNNIEETPAAEWFDFTEDTSLHYDATLYYRIEKEQLKFLVVSVAEGPPDCIQPNENAYNSMELIEIQNYSRQNKTEIGRAHV
jgi:hypothetical protein